MSSALKGIGIDIVSVTRFAAALARTPGLTARLFREEELVTAAGLRRSAASLAARFAAKEATAKALGVPRGMDWHHCSVVSDASGRPRLEITATVQAAAERLGITGWELSLTHDAGIAAAIVVACS